MGGGLTGGEQLRLEEIRETPERQGLREDCRATGTGLLEDCGFGTAAGLLGVFKKQDPGTRASQSQDRKTSLPLAPGPAEL